MRSSWRAAALPDNDIRSSICTSMTRLVQSASATGRLKTALVARLDGAGAVAVTVCLSVSVTVTVSVGTAVPDAPASWLSSTTGVPDEHAPRARAHGSTSAAATLARDTVGSGARRGQCLDCRRCTAVACPYARTVSAAPRRSGARGGELRTGEEERAVEPCPAKVGVAQVRAEQVGPPQVGVAQVRSDEQRSPEVRRAQVPRSEVRRDEVGSCLQAPGRLRYAVTHPLPV